MSTNPAAGATAAQDPSMEEILASIRRILSEDETSASAAKAAPYEAPADHRHGGATGVIETEAEPLADDVLDLDPGMLVMPATPPPPAPAPAAHPAVEVAQTAAAEPSQIHPPPTAPLAAKAPDPFDDLPDLPPSPAPSAAKAPDPFDDLPDLPPSPAPSAAKAPDPFDDLPDPPPPAPEPASAAPTPITASPIPPSHNATEAMEPDLNAPVAEPPIDPPVVAVSHLVAPAAAAAAAESLGSLVRTLAAERATAVHRGGPTIEDLVREEVRPLLKEWLDTHLPPIVERMVRAEIERVVSRMQT